MTPRRAKLTDSIYPQSQIVNSKEMYLCMYVETTLTENKLFFLAFSVYFNLNLEVVHKRRHAIFNPPPSSRLLVLRLKYCRHKILDILPFNVLLWMTP